MIHNIIYMIHIDVANMAAMTFVSPRIVMGSNGSSPPPLLHSPHSLVQFQQQIVMEAGDK